MKILFNIALLTSIPSINAFIANKFTSEPLLSSQYSARNPPSFLPKGKSPTLGSKHSFHSKLYSSSSTTTSSPWSLDDMDNGNNGFSTKSNTQKPSSVANDPTSLSASNPINNSKSTTSRSLEMPWSEWQEWALHDNLPKYLVSIPKSLNGKSSSSDTQSYALWHTMIREVTELNGYSVSFVRKMHARSLSKNSSSSSSSTTTTTAISDSDATINGGTTPSTNKNTKTHTPEISKTPGALPLLDQFQFEPNGGITGKAYGLVGIANGAMIQTPPLPQSQLSFTISNGYVLLELENDDDQENLDMEEENTIILAYELGNPLGMEEDDISLLDSKEKRTRMLKTLANTISSSPNSFSYANNAILETSTTTTQMTDQMVQSAIQTGGKTLNSIGRAVETIDEDVDTKSLLVNVGGLTAFLLAGATIMNAFHHHLTVHVFWV